MAPLLLVLVALIQNGSRGQDGEMSMLCLCSILFTAAPSAAGGHPCEQCCPTGYIGWMDASTGKGNVLARKTNLGKFSEISKQLFFFRDLKPQTEFSRCFSPFY
jgi:hypothetical protein